MDGELGVGVRRKSRGCGVDCDEGKNIAEQRRIGLGLKARSRPSCCFELVLEEQSNMPSRWALQGPLQEEEIEDLQQEIILLKRRMSMLEQRKDVSPLARDFGGIHPRDDQIFSIYTTPSIELGFEEFEDPLSNSSSLPLYDEPVYDVYDDDMLGGVLDLDQPVYDDDVSMVDTPMKIVIPIISDKTTNMLTVNDSEIGMTKLDHDNHLGTFIHSDTNSLEMISVDTDMCIVDSFYVQFNSTCEEFCLEELLKMPSEFVSYLICHRLQLMWKSLQDGANDNGWKYPDLFSQPKPPPSCGQQIFAYEPEVPLTPVV